MKSILSFLFLVSTTLWAQDYGTLHFEDHFEDNTNGWSERNDEDHVNKIKKGHFVMDHKNSSTGAYYFTLVPDIDFENQNFVIEAKIKQTSGDESQAYGLRYCIYKDYGNYRNFYVSSNGSYKVSHYYKEKDHKQIDWSNDKPVVKGLGEYNTFRVERNTNLMKYYVNDTLVGYTDNNIYFTSRIGFFVSGENKIEIDYLKVWTSQLNMNIVPDVLDNVKLENLGPMVNSDSVEKVPVISPDGQTLFYSRSEPDKSFEDQNSEAYYSSLGIDGSWKKGQSLGKPINNAGKNSVAHVMPDGNTLILMNQYKSDGSSAGGGLSRTKRTMDGWEMPENIVIEDYHNNSQFVGYAFSPSGKVMIHAAERNETTGGRDLYVSFKQEDGSWSKPIGIGPTLNTITNEDSPFIAPDNKTLYFSSEGHPGFGRADIFVTRRLDDTWTNWSKPQNLGKSINTRSSEYGFKIDAKGEFAYFYKQTTEDNGGLGDSDIFRIQLSESARPEPIVFVEGKVFDSETKLPLAAEIIYEDLQSEKELGIANSEPKEGRYKIALPYGKVYGFLAKKDGYYSISQNIDLSEMDELKTVVQDLYLTPIKKGVGIRLNNIFFEHDKAELQKTSYTELDRLVKLLKLYEEWNIEIGGHTDNNGSDSYNKELSQKRAAAVRYYLIEQGIDGSRLSAKGYGEEKPVATNDTDKGRAENRRVEFTILE